MAALTTRDLRALLDLVGAIGYDVDADALAYEVLDRLLQVLDAAWATYHVTQPDPLTGPLVVDRYVGAAGEPWVGGPDDVFWETLASFPLVAAPRRPVQLLSDVTTRRALLRNPFFNEVARHVDSVTHAVLALPDRLDGGWRILFFEREVAAKPFGARERAILETVRPFLCRPISAGDAVRRRQRAAGLTARELEVLAAVREGLTNDGIAARLLVSEGTVRKHLEHVSAKLGARTRAEAVAMAWR